MRAVLIESHFLPSLEYFCAVWPFETITIEKHEHFAKQSYRNRCYVMTSHGRERLTVPVTPGRSSDGGKSPVTSVEIDYTIRWQNTFWRTLHSAYAHAPFFLHYADDLHEKIFSRQRFMYDLNMELLSMCLVWLKSPKKISESVTYEKPVTSGQTDLRTLISTKSDFSTRLFYQPAPYPQVFGSQFVPNLSIIDLVFCEGPQAPALLTGSMTGNLNK